MPSIWYDSMYVSLNATPRVLVRRSQGCDNKESESDTDSARATSCRLELIFP